MSESVGSWPLQERLRGEIERADLAVARLGGLHRRLVIGGLAFTALATAIAGMATAGGGRAERVAIHLRSHRDIHRDRGGADGAERAFRFRRAARERTHVCDQAKGTGALAHPRRQG
jgi:hypothetical protein